ncbi:MAG: hypothetical protein DRN20_01740, partial [Thermoplasmata archaeon]
VSGKYVYLTLDKELGTGDRPNVVLNSTACVKDLYNNSLKAGQQSPWPSTQDGLAPIMLSAVTGFDKDTGTSYVKVVFSEVINMSSVSASDFAVDIGTIQGIHEITSKNVLLNVTGLMAGDRPNVTIVGDGVKDASGNALSSGEVRADDGLSADVQPYMSSAETMRVYTTEGYEDYINITVALDTNKYGAYVHIDATSVQASDFIITYSGTNYTSTEQPQVYDDYIIVPIKELPGTNITPSVQIVGTIFDNFGNQIKLQTKKTTDGIRPELDYAITRYDGSYKLAINFTEPISSDLGRLSLDIRHEDGTGITWSSPVVSDKTLTVMLNDVIESDEILSITISGVKDLSGNYIAESSTSSKDGIGPKIIEAYTAENGTAVHIVFSEDVFEITDPNIFNVEWNSQQYSVASVGYYQSYKNRLYLEMADSLPGEATPKITINGKIQDMSYNDVQTNIVDVEDKVKPVMVSATTVKPSNINRTFSEPLKKPIDKSEFRVTLNGIILEIVDISVYDKEVNLTINRSQMGTGAKPTVSIVGDVYDTNGNLAEHDSKTCGDGIPPRINGAAIVDIKHIEVYFSESLDPDSVQDVDFVIAEPPLVIRSASVNGSTVILELNCSILEVENGTTNITPRVTLKTDQEVKDLAGNVLKGSDVQTQRIWAQDKVAPVLKKAEAVDEQKVKLYFTEELKSGTIFCDNFVVAGHTIENANLSADDNSVVILYLSDKMHTDETPEVRVLAGGTVDNEGNSNDESMALTADDKMAPVIISAETCERDGVYWVKVVFSEELGWFTTDKTKYEIDGENVADIMSKNATTLLLQPASVLDPDAKPNVVVKAGAIADNSTAGANSNDKDLIIEEAEDGIAPPIDKIKTEKIGGNIVVRIYFKEALDGRPLDTSKFLIDDLSPTSASYDTENIIRLVPSQSLSTYSMPKVVIMAGAVADKSGNEHNEDIEMSAKDGVPPEVTGVWTSTKTQIKVAFSEDVNISSADLSLIWVRFDDYEIHPNKISYYLGQNDTILLNISVSIDTDEEPEVEFSDGAIEDTAGNEIAAYTRIAYDNIPPEMLSDGAKLISDTTIEVMFSEALSAGSVSKEDFEVKYSSVGYPIDSVTTSGDTVTITLSAPIDTDATPTITLVGEIEDANGNVQSSGEVNATDKAPPVIKDAKTWNKTAIRVEFSEDVQIIDESKITCDYQIKDVSVTNNIVYIELTQEMFTDARPTITIDAGALMDMNANQNSKITVTAEDGIGPEIKDAKAIAKDRITVVFSEALSDESASYMDSTYFDVSYNGTTYQVLYVDVSQDKRCVEIVLLSDLPTDAEPTVTLSKDVTDAAGNKLVAGNYVVASDKIPPEVVVAEAYDKSHIRLEFSEQLLQSSAEDESNFAVEGYAVKSAVLNGDKIVILEVAPSMSTDATPNVTITGVKDASTNSIINITLRADDKIEPEISWAEAKAKNEIYVVFSEYINPPSKNDISVEFDGTQYAISSLEYNKSADYIQSIMIYLTNELPTTSPKPNVTVQNMIDEANNVKSIDSYEAQDGIPPEFRNAKTTTRYNIEVVFSEDMDMASITWSDIEIMYEGTTMNPSTITPINDTAVNITLPISLATDAKPKVRIVGSVADKNGNEQTFDEVDAKDGVAPVISAVYLKSTTEIEVIYSENVSSTSAENTKYYYITHKGSKLTISSISVEFNKVLIKLLNKIPTDAKELYLNLTSEAEIKDKSGNTLYGPTLKYTIVDKAPPELSMAYAKSETEIELVFSEDVDAGSVSAIDFRINVTSATDYRDVLSYNVTNNVVVLTVSSMPTDARPTVRIIGEIDDLKGNPLSDITVVAGDKIPPKIVSAKTISKDKIKVEFSEVVENLNASDFEVELNTVVDVEPNNTTTKYATLTLLYDMSTDATPIVKLVGEISDACGNTQNKSEVRASDGMPPAVEEVYTHTYTTLRIEFSEAITLVRDEQIDVDGHDISDITQISDAVLEVSLLDTMNADETPTVTINAGAVVDNAGNANDPVTKDAEDKIAPTIEEAWTSTTTSVILKFDEIIDSQSVEKDDFAISGGRRVTSASMSGNDEVELHFTPSIETGEVVVVTLTGEIKDKAGNPRSGGSITAEDRLEPEIESAKATSEDTVDIEFSEDIVSPTKDQFTVVVSGVQATIKSLTYAGSSVSLKIDTKMNRNDVIMVSASDIEDMSGNVMSYTQVSAENEIPDKKPVLSNPKVDPSKGYVDTVFNFTVEYKDDDGDAAEAVYAVLLQNGIEVVNKSMILLDKVPDYVNGATYYVEISNLSEGTYTYKFVAYDGELYGESTQKVGPTVESIEKKYKYGVELSTDNVLVEIDMSEESPEGAIVLFVKNTGNTDDSYMLSYTVKNSTGALQAWSVTPSITDTIAADSMGVVNVKVTPPSGAEIGEYTMEIKATSLGDSSVTDSITVVIKSVKPVIERPSTEQFAISTTTPKAGDKVTLTYYVTNKGNMDATSVNVVFYANNAVIGSKTVNVPAGSTVPVKVTWTPKSKGTYTISVQVGEEPKTDVAKVNVAGATLLDQVTSKEATTPLLFGLIVASIIWIIILLFAARRRAKPELIAPGKKAMPEVLAPKAPRKIEIPKEREEKVEEKEEKKAEAPKEERAEEAEKKAEEAEEAKEKVAPVKVKCPKCGTITEVTSTKRPLLIPCPKCGAKLLIKE